MVQGVAAPATATITLVANVSTAGTYTIFTNTINGVTFSASGTFGGTGNNTVTLTPTGTPTLGGNYTWATNLTPSINVYGSVITTSAPLGSSYTAHFNGITAEVSIDNTLASYTTGEIFSNNTTCQSKPISAQGCGGVTSVTASSGRAHVAVNINGQCWLQTNLITAPVVYSTYTTTSWTNTSPGDQGIGGTTIPQMQQELVVGKVLSLLPTKVVRSNGVEQWMLPSVNAAVAFALRVGMCPAIVNGCI
jgi:hypothetical protein